MINLETVEREINELETQYTTSYRLCERLAWLYVVRDHLKAAQNSGDTSSMVTPYMDGSEFLQAASNVRYQDLMGIIDEHLSTVRLLYPKTYSALVDKIRQL